MPTPTNAELIAGLYTAFFNRAPDAAGLTFWEGRFSAGATVRDLAAGFASHPVFEATYGALDNRQFVEAVYVNVLGGTGDSAGINYWVGSLDAGQHSRDQMVADFVHSALSADLTAARDRGELTQQEFELAVQRQSSLTNKAEIGVDYAKYLGGLTNLSSGTDPNSKASLESDNAYLAAQAIISHINSDPRSMYPAEALIGAGVAHLEAGGSANGNLFALKQGNAGAAETISHGGVARQQDVYFIDTLSFSAGDTIRLTNFEYRQDSVYFGGVYDLRKASPATSNSGALELFGEQQGSDVLLTVERSPAGGTSGDVLKIVVVGALLSEFDFG